MGNNRLSVTLLIIFSYICEKWVEANESSCGNDPFPSLADSDSVIEFLQLSLECRDWNATIKLSSCRANQLGVADESDIYISTDPDVNSATLDEQCRFSSTNDSVVGEAFATFLSYGACQANVSMSENYIESSVYTLNLKMEKQPSDETVERRTIYRFLLQCDYDWRLHSFLGDVVPIASSFVISKPIYGGGVTATRMRAFSDSELKHEFDSTDSFITIPRMFYVLAELEALQQNMILQATRCWATPTSDPDYPDNFVFISDGCTEERLITQGWVDVLENYQSSRVVFGVKSFFWSGRWKQEIYIHCDLKICDRTAPGKNCTENRCSPRAKRELKTTAAASPSMGSLVHPSFGIQVIDESGICLGSPLENGIGTRCQDICSVVDGRRVCRCFSGRTTSTDDSTCTISVPKTDLFDVDVESGS